MRRLPRSLPCLLISSALTVAALPAMAAECKQLAIVDSLDMKPLPSGRPSLAVTIAGTPRTMLLDTGGAYSAVTQKTAQELKLVQTRTGRAIRGVNGAQSDMLARLPTIDIGRLHQDNALYYVLPANNAAGGAEFDGILSGEFLKQYDADFDFAAHKLNLFSQDHCDSKGVYWQAPAVAVVPFSLDSSSHIKFPMELDGKKVNAVLDTGAARTTLSLTVAQRAFNVNVNAPDVEKIGEINGGFKANVYRRRFTTLAVDKVVVNNPMVVLLPDLETGAVRQSAATGSLTGGGSTLPDLLIGAPTLNLFHVYVAYKERKVYITASAAPPAEAAQTAQAQASGFCPSPSDTPPGIALAANPTTEAGMTAFRNRNVETAYANLRPLADTGNAEAARDLGVVLRQTCARSGNKAAAAAWFEKAAGEGDLQAAAQLGDMYEFGDGLTKDGPAAFKWLSIAANGGIKPAQADLGELYFTGLGIAQDRYQGLVWSIKAGEDGRPLALFRIGREYMIGGALPKDALKAMLYMTAGIQRLPAGRRPEFQPVADNLAKQMKSDDVIKAKQNAQQWMPGPGSLAEVQAEADKLHSH